MTQAGKDAALLPEVRFENPRLAALGVEPMSVAELRRKAGARLSQPERVDFFMLMLVTAGQGVHTVDFLSWPVRPGTVIFVQPGQVQQWQAEDAYEGALVLIDPGALPDVAGQVLARELALLGLVEWQAALDLEGAALQAVRAGMAQLREDFAAFAGAGLDIALIRHELMALLVRVARAQQARQQAGAGQGEGARLAYRLFVQALEAGFAQAHSLQYYARRLGYSASTLSRACMAAEGRTAKAVISRRIALEARRLLAHSPAAVADVAHRLGFSEATNFVKFFRRETGLTPAAFRKAMTRAA